MTSNASAQPESNVKASRPALNHDNREGCVPANLEKARSWKRDLEEANANLQQRNQEFSSQTEDLFCAESEAKRTESRISCDKREEEEVISASHSLAYTTIRLNCTT
jgi:hypothetical protein